MREMLPNRRQSTSFGLSFRGLDYVVTYATYPGSAQVAEIFLTLDGRVGSEAEATARDAMIYASILLQCGYDLDALRRSSTREDDGSPNSIGGAALDAVAIVLAEDEAMLDALVMEGAS